MRSLTHQKQAGAILATSKDLGAVQVQKFDPKHVSKGNGPAQQLGLSSGMYSLLAKGRR